MAELIPILGIMAGIIIPLAYSLGLFRSKKQKRDVD